MAGRKENISENRTERNYEMPKPIKQKTIYDFINSFELNSINENKQAQ